MDERSPQGPDEHARLIGLLDEQEGLYGQLDRLSHLQRAAIDGGETDALLGVLHDRQGVIERIRRNAEAFAPLRERWDDVLGRLSPEERELVRKRVDALSAQLEAIVARDDADRLALEAQRDAVGRSAAGVQRGGRAVAAYGAPVVRKGPRFQDREA